MTPTELRYVIAVARERHFGKAAQICNVTQPTLSLGIKKLEEELNITLFERSHKDISVTTAGEKIVDQAIRALREINAIKELAHTLNNPLALPIRLGAIYTIGPYLFPHLIPVLRRNAPDLSLMVEENFTVNLVRRLHNGEIDVAILSLPFDEPGLRSYTVYEEPFSVLLPGNHHLAREKSVSVEQVENDTVLLLGPNHCFRDQVLEICPHCIKNTSTNNNLQQMLEGSSLETIRHMVASGTGISILPMTAICSDSYSGNVVEVRPFSDVKPKRKVAVVWRQGFPRMEAISIIVDAIHNCQLHGVNFLKNTFAREVGSISAPIKEKSTVTM